jgi:membrane fusion protein (multidrug efflux system)
VVLVVAAVFGLRWLAYTRTHVSSDDAQIESDIYPVSARIAGHVREVYADTNQEVRAGQLLVAVDPKDYQVALAQAEAGVAQAKSAAQAATSTVGVTQETGAAGISGAEAAQGAAQAQQVMSERESESASSQVEAATAEEMAAGQAVEIALRQVASSRAAVTSAQATAEQAQRDASRMEKLRSDGAVSAQQRDAAVAANISAQANVEAAQAVLQSSQAGVAQARQRLRQATVAVAQAGQKAAAARAAVAQASAAVRQAEAAVRSSRSSPAQVRVRRFEAGSAEAQSAAAQARLEQAQLDLSYTRVVAPVEGTVAAKNVEPGQFIQPGQPLMAIVSRSGTHVTANLKETQLTHVSVGQRATLTVDAYPGLTFFGRVESLSPGTGSVFSLLPPENASGNFTKVVQRVPVRIAVDWKTSPQRALRAGMSVIVSIETSGNRASRVGRSNDARTKQ